MTDFHKEEYQSLHREIEASVKEERELERYVLVATAGVWTWLATHREAVANPCFYWIPAIIVVLATVRSYALLRSIRRIAAYVRTMEQEFASHPPKGWETFIQKPRDYWITWSGAFFWICLFLATCVAPCLVNL